jgi:nickel-type superoxide dismutase maturation protease
MLLLTKFRITGHSMEPTIKSKQMVLASGLFYLFKKPRIGDIVAFREKDKVFIKRIQRVVRDKYFLTGDNREDSLDSRKFGFISQEQILGKIIY